MDDYGPRKKDPERKKRLAELLGDIALDKRSNYSGDEFRKNSDDVSLYLVHIPDISQPRV